MHAHLVPSSVIKYRHQLFTSRHLERMEQIMPDVCAESSREPTGEPGHVHLPVNLLPTAAISHLASSLKGVSSRRLRPQFPTCTGATGGARRLWSGSYFAGSAGGAPISALPQYTEQQGTSRLTRLGPGRLHHPPEEPTHRAVK